ncbi:NADP-dependent oxidoreductase [Actinomyces faecalis]|uniref:NADP-dependent oxidoreductase n=1 Tax=Actinomyces faecalis TaxID=2722820 RepID=UPI0015545C21|nr:NADP-dependent oxidoreductase [Actinomyces faecalis]
MRAYVLDRYGAPLRATQIARPEPKDHEVLVRVVASGVNHLDERLRLGELKSLFPLHLPKVMGSELSGEVIQVGRQVHGLAVGDKVYGFPGPQAMGSFAQYVTVDAAALALAPSSVPLVDVAGLPVVGLSVWQGLVGLGGLSSGQRVLIHGGGGGVGSIAIQVAKYLGAYVITTASASSAQAVRDLGADEHVDYTSQDFTHVLRHRPVDLVLDTQGGKVLERSLQVVRKGGMVVSLAGTPEPTLADRLGSGIMVKAALGAMSWRLRRRAARLGVTYRFLFIQPDRDGLRSLARMVDDGVLRPVVGRVLPAEQTLQALEVLLAGGVHGKIIVSHVLES